ncbi:MAG: replication-associated recombination protein A [Kofleriaceae bacterium]
MSDHDLFSHAAQHRRTNQPLAERMRPRSLAELVGQEQLLAPGKILGGIGPGRHLPSLLLWGPPGCGKTTLARLLGEAVRAEVVVLSAVDSGVKEVREVVARAAQKRDERGLRTLLFIDEIHRFSRAQQDALLPHVERGTITLIGATTENPSFGVVAALLSRCRVLRLEALSAPALKRLAEQALRDRERGLGQRPTEERAELDEQLERLVTACGGDARRLLTMLEVAVELARQAAGDGPVRLLEEHVAQAVQGKTLLYDRSGDEHYGVVSALIKSLRGSDPDAAVYWMTRMLEAGEDPRFVVRRLVIFAAEDVGNADPQALGVATAALHAFELVGLPEGALVLTQAAVYLALAPKSNRALTTYAAARKAVLEHGALPVPAKLRNAATELGRAMGHGQGYRYPHDFEGAYVEEDYLPDALVGETFYQPSSSGFEQELGRRLAARQARGPREIKGSRDPGET